MSMEHKEQIIDAATGEIAWRDYTKEEIEASEKARLEHEKLKAERLAKQAEAAAAKAALLAKLGITEEEAKLLLS